MLTRVAVRDNTGRAGRRWRAALAGAHILSGCLLLACGGAAPDSAEEVDVDAPAPDSFPVFALDPSWPAPLADADAPWPDLERNATSVAVDPRDHVWMMQLPTPEELAAEAAGGPAVPRVFEFDPAGNVLRSWGGPGGGVWMLPPDPEMPYPSGTPAEHGMFVDHGNNVWVTGNGHVALKFSPEGELLLQVGEPGRTNGSNDTALLGNSCELTVDPARNELYVADGYNNRRVIVFDADTGEYRRHWGAYGDPPVDFELTADGLYTDESEMYVPGAPPQRQLLAVHCVRVSNDGLVYVCDRQRNRVQIFERDGSFVDEFPVAPDTPADLGFPVGVDGVRFGSASTIGFSADPAQRYLYVGDNMNAAIWVYRRRDLELLGSLATNPSANHYLSVDSAGNIYNSGLQKFVFQGVRRAPAPRGSDRRALLRSGGPPAAQ